MRAPMPPHQSQTNAQPLNFFHFDDPKKSGGSRGWYDKGYSGNKQKKSIFATIRDCVKRIPLPSVRLVLFLATICAISYGCMRAYKAYLIRQENAPKVSVYLHNGCRGESIAFNIKDGIDLKPRKTSGIGIELCKKAFPGGVNANDQVRSIRVERGASLNLYEHCTGPFRTALQDANGVVRSAGPFQPLSETLEGGRGQEALKSTRVRSLERQAMFSFPLHA